MRCSSCDRDRGDRDRRGLQALLAELCGNDDFFQQLYVVSLGGFFGHAAVEPALSASPTVTAPMCADRSDRLTNASTATDLSSGRMSFFMNQSLSFTS